ncbi:Calcium-binding EF hand family protein [Rhynchospora pubera]|uniref:Calcium-binding EF hand family protein n=1 Tax=Rhynchospora pubera TaxID=906938 RepID=A0AAV8D9S8_9POAL|nr:Calcium-binding EF hand family protein [Rhynchospora pubera]
MEAITIISLLVSALKRLKQSLLLSYLGFQGPLQFTLFCIILNFNFLILDKFYPKKLPYLYCFLINPLSDCPCYNPPSEELPEETEFNGATKIKEVILNRDEVMLAMERICQNTTKGGDQIENCMGYEDFSGLFQESEPSLDEVKEAFSVFDQNRDGLVDARDLQRVLNNLGVRYGANLEACERMIEQHDRNKDGNVDLADFSRLLEMSLLGNGD